MKILLLTHSYPDAQTRWRGTFVREQALALSHLHDVAVVFFKNDSSRFSPFGKYIFNRTNSGKLTEYEVIIPRSVPLINQVKYFSNTRSFISNEVLNNFHPDLIHSHLSYPAGFFGTVLQKLLRIPCVVTEHSWIKKHFRSRIHKMCVMYSLRNSAGYVTVSDALRQDLLQHHDREIEVIPNVINVGKFRCSGKMPGDTFNIGILGGMGNYRKGLDILIQAVAMVKEKNVFLHIGGSGSLLETFIQQSVNAGIFDKCRFYGEISTEGLQEFYDRLDAFILASRDETFGVVLVEAMACGLPVIATDCGGPREIITEETGMLIKKEDPAELAQAITTMAGNLHRYDRNKIRNYALERYGYEAFVTRMTGYYHELVNTHN